MKFNYHYCIAALAAGVLLAHKPLMAGTVQATVSFSTADSGVSLNPAFCGLSYEKSELTGSLFVSTDTSMINMFSQIGPAILRVGGNSVNRSCWGGYLNSTPITAAEVDTFAGFVKALPANWHVIYGINMATNTPANCAAEAAYAANALGSRLLGFEIGNEPDLYSGNSIRPSNYTYSQFLAEWKTYAAAITNAVPGWAITNGGNGWTFTGPASASNTQGYTVPFAGNEAGVNSLVTQHYYRGNGASPSSTVQLLLQPDTGLPGKVSSIVAAATAANLPLGFRMDECGSFYNGGAPNVSDAYGTALWALDFMFTIALNGGQGVNFHGGGDGTGYTPIADNGTSVVQARPEFYGLKMFSLLPQGNVIPATVSLASNINFTAYGVRQTNGMISAVLINKDTNNYVQMTINLGTNVSAAQSIVLTGPTLNSTSGYTIGGAPINADGSWAGGVQSVVSATDSQLTIIVPPISAILLNPIQISSLAPVVAITVPAANIVYLNSTNQTLLLTATASNTVPANAMTTAWSQTGGPGTVTFGNSNTLTTTANFSTNGTYGINFTASNGATNSASLTVVVNSSIGAVTNGLLGWWKMDETGGTTAFDSSGNGANATVHGGTFTNGYLANALYLTGGTNNASFTSADAAQTTVAAWVYADGNGGSSYPRILVAPGCYLNFRFDGSANNNALDFATTTTTNGATVDGEWVAPPNSIGTGAWYHVAVSYDKSSTANVPALYVNGVRMGLTTFTSPSIVPPSSAGTTYIGNRLDLTRGWDGLIDDLRIYNRLLSDSEVQSLAETPPNLAPTVGAGANQTVIWPAAANLNGTVADDGYPNPPGAVTVTWSEVSGPGTITFANSNAVATTANFSVAGNYQLQLAANDGQVTTVSSLMVAVITQPNLSFQLLPGAIQLSWPSNNGNWQLQFQTNLSATDWQNLPGTITNPFVAPIDPTAPSVFYRLLLMTN